MRWENVCVCYRQTAPPGHTKVHTLCELSEKEGNRVGYHNHSQHDLGDLKHAQTRTLLYSLALPTKPLYFNDKLKNAHFGAHLTPNAFGSPFWMLAFSSCVLSNNLSALISVVTLTVRSLETVTAIRTGVLFIIESYLLQCTPESSWPMVLRFRVRLGLV